MRAYDCIRGTPRISFKRLVGNKHVIYCVGMAFFSTDLNANTFLIPPDQFSLSALQSYLCISKY